MAISDDFSASVEVLLTGPSLIQAKASEIDVDRKHVTVLAISFNMVRLSRSELIRFDRDEKAYELKSATAQ